jgi:multimeric flavodoxin WrbA
MKEVYVICPNDKISTQLKKMLDSFIEGFDIAHYISSAYYTDFQNKKILFLLELDSSTYFDIPMLNFFNNLDSKSSNIFQGSTAALLIHSNSELGTKRAAQDIIFMANNLGCNFIGHPLVEATVNLKNFLTWQKSLRLPLEEICINLSSKLGKRLAEYETSEAIKKITVLYSSPHKISNTLDLWHLISKYLKKISIEELQIENGKILDCKGCHYRLCLHYGKQNSCFYGGFMVENVLPSIESSDAVVWLCPNYNDSIGANLTATINRLTVLYHKISFYNKALFGIVISGNSGSDSVAKQLIGALNINKGFRLPPNSIITETANNPKAIFEVPDIELKAKAFAATIMNSL